MKLILASASPRRSALLAQAGLDFTVRPADADETLENNLLPNEAVQTLALRKARAASNNSGCSDDLIIAADTVVALGNTIFGKPASREDAVTMLRTLSGKTHQVCTGVCLYRSENKMDLFSCQTDVTFFSLTDAEINAYLDSEEYLDKAGAYGIQGLGAVLVEKIHGDYNNVVGLPLSQVVRRLKAFI